MDILSLMPMIESEYGLKENDRKEKVIFNPETRNCLSLTISCTDLCRNKVFLFSDIPKVKSCEESLGMNATFCCKCIIRIQLYSTLDQLAGENMRRALSSLPAGTLAPRTGQWWILVNSGVFHQPDQLVVSSEMKDIDQVSRPAARQK